LRKAFTLIEVLVIIAIIAIILAIAAPLTCGNAKNSNYQIESGGGLFGGPKIVRIKGCQYIEGANQHFTHLETCDNHAKEKR
jgi:prepilin-type N-terminal cleavage/methylation domain-containing protein